ncbi:glutamate-5-semialdehyde dehydrogenase [Candidatus Woesearchaeota archaeon]|nr:glutamate-5-semialdehyde dehydrogenase [Candidatus Woesearchaeota archaeon]
MIETAKKAKEAAFRIANIDSKLKNNVISSLCTELEKRKNEIISENSIDLEKGKKKNLSSAILDRLKLDDKRIAGMVEGLRQIIALEDPIGEVIEERKLRSGIFLKKVRVPIGVILMIFEARPNVTIDSFALCFKAGNSVILKGGSDALHSNRILAKIIQEVLAKNKLPEECCQLVESHEAIDELLKLNEHIDLVIPRGGERLIKFVVEKSMIPVIMHYKGICHTYVDKDADIKNAVEICYNAKCQRPGVCNAMETLLVHKDVAKSFLPKLAERMSSVELRGCERTRGIIKAKPATKEDWNTEYLDLILSIKIVDSVDDAISHINKYGSKHSDAIVTEDKRAQENFLKRVDSSSVFVNCSTRFNDGFEYGLGAEIGISTQKLHARGPMGLRELTTYKYLLLGHGEIRK